MEEESKDEPMDVTDTNEEEDESEESDSESEKSDEESEKSDDESEEQNDGQPPKRKVYLPGQKIKNNEVLEPDSSAYVMLHEAYAG